ncbi:ABC transporter ATP-binding protein [Geodermatophilus sp. SYSU D00703]
MTRHRTLHRRHEFRGAASRRPRTPDSWPPNEEKRPGGHPGWRVYKRLVANSPRCRLPLLGLLALSVLAAPLALLTPLPLKIVLDNVIGDEPSDSLSWLVPGDGPPSQGSTLAIAVGIVIVIAVLVELQFLASEVLGVWVGERLRLDLRTKLFHRAQRLSLAYHDTVGTADSLCRIEKDATAVKFIPTVGIAPVVTAALTLAGMFVVTARIDPQLAAVSLVVSPLLYLATRASARRLRTMWADAMALESSALAVVSEVLGGLRVVKAFGGEDREQERFVSRSGESARAHVRIAVLDRGFAMLVGLILGTGSAAALLIGTDHVRQGRITAGDLVLIMAYIAALYAPLKTIATTVGNLQMAFAAAERAFDLLDEDPEVVERPEARRLGRAEGHLAFECVSFHYPGGGPVLQNVSFEVPAGCRVGVAGATGAGKTTLISLLARFYDPVEGRILLDDVDLRDYRLADLRRQFAIVLQDSLLFSTSIWENIAYARPGASTADIVAAARAANAHEFIARLPDGYDTVVGERGATLSGGERQRIALARAFLRDAPILVLDEPTSALDIATEVSVMEAMERLMAGRTTFLISHRPSTLASCDVLVRVSGGVERSIEVQPLPDGKSAAVLSEVCSDPRPAPSPLGR